MTTITITKTAITPNPAEVTPGTTVKFVNDAANDLVISSQEYPDIHSGDMPMGSTYTCVISRSAEYSADLPGGGGPGSGVIMVI